MNKAGGGESSPWRKRSPAALLLLGAALALGAVFTSAAGAAPGEAPSPAKRDLLRAKLEAIRKEAPGSEREAGALAELAETDAAAGDLKDAATEYESAIAVRQRLAPTHPLRFTWELRLGELYLRLEALSDAEAHYINAREGVAAGSTEQVLALEGLGRTQALRSAWERSLASYEQALRLRRTTLPDPKAEIQDCLGLAEAYEERGRHEEADRFLVEAAGCREAARRDLAAAILYGRGVVAEHRWELGEALSRYRDAATVLRALGTAPNELARAMVKVAWMERQTADVTGAWRDVNIALELIERYLPGTPQHARALQSASDIAQQRGDRRAGEMLMGQAEEVLERWSPKSQSLAQLYVNRGNLLLTSDQPVAARVYYEKAFALLQELSPEAFVLGTVLFNISISYYDEQRPEKALEIIDQTIEIYRRASPNSARMAHAMAHRARCLDALNRHQEADALYQQSLPLWERTAPTSPTRVRSLFFYATHLSTMGDTKGAVRVAEDAWSLWNRTTRDAGNDEARQAISAARMKQAEVLVQLLTDDGQTQRALQVLEEARARALWRSLQESGDRPPGVSDEQWSAYSDARTARRSANARLAGAGDGVARLEAIRGKGTKEPEPPELIRAREELRAAQEAQLKARLRVDALWAQLGRALPEETPPPDFPSAMQVMDRVRATGTAAVEFVVGPKQTLLFVLEPTPPGRATPPLRAFRISVSQAQLVQQVRELTRSLREARADAAELSRKLGALLFPPQAASALRSGKRAVIVPDGPLWELPFAALRLPAGEGKTEQYLGLEMPLAAVHSLAFFARDLARAAPAPEGAAPQVLAVGDPAFSPPGVRLAAAPGGVRSVSSPLPAPAPLPGTRQDASNVARLYGATPLLGRDATEATVRRRLEVADIAHLATHGYVHPYWPGASRIYLAYDPDNHPLEGAAPSANDGVLEAWEIGNQLHLRADLVVLAACETNGGSVIGGEGIDGLVRSLLRAGAHSIVASHWQVRDDGTRALMLAFHHGVRSGLAKDEALHLAMLQVARHPGWEHPYYWAAFALTGDRENHVFPARKSSPAGAAAR